MPATWDATASNQLVTIDALKDVWGTRLWPSGASFTESGLKIVTKSFVESKVKMDTGNTTWSALSSLECPTKNEIITSAFFYALFYANRLTGNAGYDITVVHKRGGTTLQTKTRLINETSCGNLDAKIDFLDSSGTNAIRYNDVLEFSNYYSGTATAIELKASYSGYDCGTENYATCGENFTMVRNLIRSYQPKSYNACV